MDKAMSYCTSLMLMYEYFENGFEFCDEKILNKNFAEQKRSMAQLIYHLSAYENFYFSMMLKRFLYDKYTNVSQYDDSDEVNVRPTKKEVELFICTYGESRRSNIELIKNNYELMKSRCIIHDIHGRLFIDDIIEKVIEHDDHHFKQFSAILSAAGVSYDVLH